MNINALEWIGGALGALVLAAGALLFGVNLLPDRATVIDAGTLIPWYVAWIMTLATAGIGLGLAVFLVSSAKPGHSHHDHDPHVRL